ncbi:hypothetical protein DERP_005268 [Dermatophagoides pteronyssinus]|uniref:Uncharacterized protein n=1 Tax=Dermatophagoides pteronyssinus TaxID=6956 RepID=A0ABQ8JMN3_DERPT|nr:hypothetical protein DERP_005268 [Dermatophagoides pteronyssinus]
MGCIQSTCQTNNNQQQDTFSKYSSISDQVEIDESDCIKISNSNTEKSQQLIMMKKMIDDKNIFMPKLSKNSIRIPAIKVDYRKLKAKMEQEEIFRKAAAKIGFLSKLQDDDSVDDNNTDIIMVNNKIDGQKFSSAICSGIEKISPTNEKVIDQEINQNLHHHFQIYLIDSGSTQTIYTDSLSVLSSTKSIKSDFISTRSNNTISQIGRINELQKIEQQTKSHSSIEDI